MALAAVVERMPLRDPLLLHSGGKAPVAKEVFPRRLLGRIRGFLRYWFQNDANSGRSQVNEV